MTTSILRIALLSMIASVEILACATCAIAWIDRADPVMEIVMLALWTAPAWIALFPPARRA